MVAAIDLLARSGDLKRELVEFAEEPRYDRAFQEALTAHGDPDAFKANEEQAIAFIDYFVLQHRLRNGKKIVEQFVASRPDLPEVERDLVLGWRDVVEGVFEVVGREGDAVVVVNLIDELTYRVRSNIGPQTLRPLRRGSFTITRLIPIGDEWLVSGITACFGKPQRERMCRIAAEFAWQQPELVFRNPDKLARAWEMQRAEHDRFIRFFGADFVVIAGCDLTERMREYFAFARDEVQADLSAQGESLRFANQPLPEPGYGPELVDSSAVGVSCDEVEGFGFYAEFGPIEDAFADPDLLGQPRYHQHVSDYLDDDSVSPLPFRKLAERNPARASEVFRQLLCREDFDWEHDGEKLLRQRKPTHFPETRLPRTLPLSERLAPYAVSDCT